MSVSGVTKTELQRLRESSRLAAARNLRSADRSAGRATLAPQDRELMTEHDDLELLELLGTTGERDELKQASQGDVEHRSEQARPPVSKGAKARDPMDASGFRADLQTNKHPSLRRPDRIYAPHTTVAWAARPNGGDRQQRRRPHGGLALRDPPGAVTMAAKP
jgi:hypothetical protein